MAKKERCEHCKRHVNAEELGEDLSAVGSKKMPFLMKLKLSFEFFVFYFIFTNTAILNFIINDKLEPVFPKKLRNKYMMADGEKP